MALTAAQLEQYRNEGYAVGGRILNDDELARLRAVLDSAWVQSEQVIPAALWYYIEIHLDPRRNRPHLRFSVRVRLGRAPSLPCSRESRPPQLRKLILHVFQ